MKTTTIVCKYSPFLQTLYHSCPLSSLSFSKIQCNFSNFQLYSLEQRKTKHLTRGQCRLCENTTRRTSFKTSRGPAAGRSATAGPGDGPSGDAVAPGASTSTTQSITATSEKACQQAKAVQIVASLAAAAAHRRRFPAVVHFGGQYLHWRVA